MFKLCRILVFCSVLWLPIDALELNNETETTEGDQLIFAHVIFRHGDRNPVFTYPTDPWSSPAYWPEGFGQLTSVGIQQEYELGKYLRKRYASLLGNGRYSNEVVYVQSTDYDRTLMSAEACLSGLFPPAGNQVWSKDIQWQPIPVHTIPIEMDYVLYAGRPCPRYAHALRKYLSSPQVTAFYENHKQLFQFLEQHSGIQIQSLDDVEVLYNTLWIQKLKNRTLPAWTKDVFVEGGEFEWCAFNAFTLLTNTTELARLSTGFLLREILERFVMKMKSMLIPDRSLWIYSAHDTTLANILNSLGVFEPHNPPYSSSVHIELYWSDDAKYYIQLFYRNTTDEQLTPIEIPKCGAKCSIEKFIIIYSEIIPDGEFEDECRLPFYLRIIEGTDIFRPRECFIAFICLAFMLPVLLIVSVKMFYRRRGIIAMENDDMKYL